MNRKLLFKKKHLFCLIPLFFLLVIILGGIIVLALLYIGFSWKNKKMKTIAKGTHWNISMQDFENSRWILY